MSAIARFFRRLFNPAPDRAARRYVANSNPDAGPRDRAPLAPADRDALDAVWDAVGLCALDEEVQARPHPSRRWVAPAAWSAAGTALAASLLAAMLVLPQSGLVAETYETRTGEQRMVRLTDGSLVTLNTSSRVSATIGDRQRRVTLDRGEAFFDIAPMADASPFTVEARGLEVRVLGTQFNVRAFEGGLAVDVLEGHVEVARAQAASDPGSQDNIQLVAGEGAQISADGHVEERRAAETARVEAWRDGRLLFDQTPLYQAVAEMNRHSQTTLVIDSPSISDLRISGMVRAGASDDFVRMLVAVHDVEVVDLGSIVRIRRARAAGDDTR